MAYVRGEPKRCALQESGTSQMSPYTVLLLYPEQCFTLNFYPLHKHPPSHSSGPETWLHIRILRRPFQKYPYLGQAPRDTDSCTLGAKARIGLVCRRSQVILVPDQFEYQWRGPAKKKKRKYWEKKTLVNISQYYTIIYECQKMEKSFRMNLTVSVKIRWKPYLPQASCNFFLFCDSGYLNAEYILEEYLENLCFPSYMFGAAKYGYASLDSHEKEWVLAWLWP